MSDRAPGPDVPPIRDDADVLRLRTATELHDGVLQTLTAASLQLEVARRTLHVDPAQAERLLVHLMENVASEQRELRLFIDELRGKQPLWADRAVPLFTRVRDMLERIETIWDVQVDLTTSGTQEVPQPAERQVLRLVQEAVVNAARHGAARSVAVVIDVSESGIEIRLADDGHGFPFHGEFGGAELKAKRLGPVSIKRRVEANRGTLHIRSAPEGASLRITLPLDAGRDA